MKICLLLIAFLSISTSWAASKAIDCKFNAGWIDFGVNKGFGKEGIIHIPANRAYNNVVISKDGISMKIGVTAGCPAHLNLDCSKYSNLIFDVEVVDEKNKTSDSISSGSVWDLALPSHDLEWTTHLNSNSPLRLEMNISCRLSQK
jgi:hypothetical protein